MPDESNSHNQSAGAFTGDPRRPRTSTVSPGGVFAIFLIFVGVVLFLDNLGLVRARDVWHFWPVVLIAIGLSKLLSSRGAASRTWAAMIAAIGVLFLLRNIGWWHVSDTIFIPVLLIGVGVLMLVNVVSASRSGAAPMDNAAPGFSENVLREWVVFGGVQRRIATQDFKGGELMAVFGGIEIDLRQARIAPGSGNVVLDANATFGGIELRVPEDWRVIVRGAGIFGGYEDKTVLPRFEAGLEPPSLLITGYALFGGVTVHH